MKNFTKLLVDIGPLAVFFIFYLRSDLQSAILPFMIATIIAVLFSYIAEKKIPIMPTVGAFIILIFGGLTLYFNNDSFFQNEANNYQSAFCWYSFSRQLYEQTSIKISF